LKIIVEIIPHTEQRYRTVGDWQMDSDKLLISVSETGNWRYNVLIAVHEIIEVLLCKHDQVPQASVDQFDMDYERGRLPGDYSEPGDCPSAPYHRQHCLATGVERILAAALGVKWLEYEKAIAAL